MSDASKKFHFILAVPRESSRTLHADGRAALRSRGVREKLIQEARQLMGAGMAVHAVAKNHHRVLDTPLVSQQLSERVTGLRRVGSIRNDRM